jgi:hypothetical protein
MDNRSNESNRGTLLPRRTSGCRSFETILIDIPVKDYDTPKGVEREFLSIQRH